MSLARQPATIKELSQEAFRKFKCVRKLSSKLMGSYSLYSMHSQKYIGKELPHGAIFKTTRKDQTISKVQQANATLYLFPLLGEPLCNIGSKTVHDGEIKRWLDRCGGSVENCLWELLRKLLQMAQKSEIKEVLLECLRVHNNEAIYCYDSWLTSSQSIVMKDVFQLENYYFSQEDLEEIKASLDLGRKGRDCFSNSKVSVFYRIFLLVLNLGSADLKERNYEYGAFRLNKDHLQIKLQYFQKRHNAKGLGDIVGRAIRCDCDMQMQDIWKITLPSPQIGNSFYSSNILKPRDQNIVANRQVPLKTQYKTYEKSQQCFTPFKSTCSPRNTREKNQASMSHYASQISSDAKNDSSRHDKLKTNSNKQINLTEIKPRKKVQIKERTGQSDKKLYHLFESSEQFKLWQRIESSAESNVLNQSLLKWLGLQEYVPKNQYEQKTLLMLGGVHVKPDWQRRVYDNNSIYFGQVGNQKRNGKGLYLFNSQDVYYGEWKDNLMHGYGTYVFKTGETYQGDLKNGFKEGHGVCIYNDGREFEGSWSLNFKTGLGKVKFPNGVVFIGLFKANSLETEGVFIGKTLANDKSSSSLTDKVDIVWQRKGILESYDWKRDINNQEAQKEITLGQRSNENDLQRINEGKAERRSNEVDFAHRSKLKHCKTKSYAQYKDSADKYEGQVKNGRRQGFGISENGVEVYEGEWKNDERHGKGKLVVKKYYIIEGEWREGMLVRIDGRNE